jgi:hypothetical protein
MFSSADIEVLLLLLTHFSPKEVGNIYDATRRVQAHRQEAYSPNDLEEVSMLEKPLLDGSVAQTESKHVQIKAKTLQKCGAEPFNEAQQWPGNGFSTR